MLAMPRHTHPRTVASMKPPGTQILTDRKWLWEWRVFSCEWEECCPGKERKNRLTQRVEPLWHNSSLSQAQRLSHTQKSSAGPWKGLGDKLHVSRKNEINNYIKLESLTASPHWCPSTFYFWDIQVDTQTLPQHWQNWSRKFQQEHWLIRGQLW